MLIHLSDSSRIAPSSLERHVVEIGLWSWLVDDDDDVD